MPKRNRDMTLPVKERKWIHWNQNLHQLKNMRLSFLPLPVVPLENIELNLETQKTAMFERSCLGTRCSLFRIRSCFKRVQQSSGIVWFIDLEAKLVAYGMHSLPFVFSNQKLDAFMFVQNKKLNISPSLSTFASKFCFWHCFVWVYYYFFVCPTDTGR